MDIGTLVTRAARRFGDRVAVEGPDADRTFAELGDRVARIANGLLAQGLRPGDRVLDLQRNSRPTSRPISPSGPPGWSAPPSTTACTPATGSASPPTRAPAA